MLMVMDVSVAPPPNGRKRVAVADVSVPEVDEETVEIGVRACTL